MPKPRGSTFLREQEELEGMGDWQKKMDKFCIDQFVRAKENLEQYLGNFERVCQVKGLSRY